MKSQKQVDANRRNALRSSGPKTEAGKRRSAVNATKHGLTTPLELSDLAPHLDTIASLLMTEECLSAPEARELARRILDYERNLQHQREQFLEFMKRREVERKQDPEPFTPPQPPSYYADRAYEIAESFGYEDNFGGLGSRLLKNVIKIYQRWGTEDLKTVGSGEPDEQPKTVANDRYLRRSANQLFKQCRRLSTHMGEP